MTSPPTDIRSIVKRQYHAALTMFEQAVRSCPDDEWTSGAHRNAFWQVAYHTMVYTYWYLAGTGSEFLTWAGHQHETQYPDCIAGPPDPNSSLPLLPKPYSKTQVLEFWSVCDRLVDSAVDAMDFTSTESGFSWYHVSKLEHQLINIRHVQHHAAQLADRLRSAADLGVRWVA